VHTTEEFIARKWKHMKDFFISYNHIDQIWAEWIALALTNAGYTLTIQSWDILPGSNFVLEMQKATAECERTIGVLSPEWLASVFTQPEWAAAFALDPTGSARKLIPVRVRPCEPTGLLKPIVYCDLVGLEEENARKTLLAGVSNVRSRPESVIFPPDFSASGIRAAQDVAARNPKRLPEEYPGVRHTAVPSDLTPLYRSAFGLLSLVRTTRATFEAQVRLRDDMVRHIHERLLLNPFDDWQYESFIAKQYPGLDDEEKRMFSTMRSFTKNILWQYNQDILKLIDQIPSLVQKIKSISQLRLHLLIWSAKYDETFLNHPEMCLLYAGVEEGTPFPLQLETELWKLLRTSPETSDLLDVEPNSPESLAEHTSKDEHWRIPLWEKWVIYRLKSIVSERQHWIEKTNPAGDRVMSVADQLAVDIEQAKLLNSKLYPQIIWRPIRAPQSLLESVNLLLSAWDPGWPAELKDALDAAKPLLQDTDVQRFALRELIPLLPVIAHHAETVAPASTVPSEWERFRSQLTDWVLAGKTP
jgi:TIR domain